MYRHGHAHDTELHVDGRLAILRAGDRSASEVAAHSRAALDRPLAHAGELWIATVADEARILGAFQRAYPDALPQHRRGSGGPEVRVAPGTVHVALSMAHPGALTPCDEKRIVNRAVRPLLRALSRVGALAHYFGRDWVSVQHRPAAWVGFAHDATTRRTLFEAFVAVRTPFAGDRASFLGKRPATLEELGVSDPLRLVETVAQAYPAAWNVEAIEAPAPVTAGSEPLAPEAPWAATTDEAIGPVGAGADAVGIFRVGGDLLVSRDALARLEARVAAAPTDDLARIVDEVLAAPGVAIDGVRSLQSLRDVIARAREAVTPAGAPRPSLP
jgi:hypothetical protein